MRPPCRLRRRDRDCSTQKRPRPTRRVLQKRQHAWQSASRYALTHVSTHEVTLIFLHGGLAILALSAQWQFSSHAHFLTRLIHTLFLLLVQLNTVDSLLLCVRHLTPAACNLAMTSTCVRHLTPAACNLAMTSTGGERSKDGEARGREARGGVTTRRGLG